MFFLRWGECGVVICRFFFSILPFSKKSFSNSIRVSNSLDPNKWRHLAGLDLGTNYLQKLSEVNDNFSLNFLKRRVNACRIEWRFTGMKCAFKQKNHHVCLPLFFLFILPRYDCNLYNIGQPLKVILRNKFLTCDSRKPLLVSHFFNVGRMLLFVDLLKCKRLRITTKLTYGTMCVTKQNSLSGSPGRRKPRTAMKIDEILLYQSPCLG